MEMVDGDCALHQITANFDTLFSSQMPRDSKLMDSPFSNFPFETFCLRLIVWNVDRALCIRVRKP